MATHAFHTGVRRVLVGGELGLHHVTALSAELDRLHVLYRPVCALCSNDDVDSARHGEENDKLANVNAAVGGRRLQPLLDACDASPGKEHPQSSQHQAEDEDNRDKNKNYNADVGIVAWP